MIEGGLNTSGPAVVASSNLNVFQDLAGKIVGVPDNNKATREYGWLIVLIYIPSALGATGKNVKLVQLPSQG